MSVAVAIILLVLASMAFGVTLLLSYLVTRMLRDSVFDDSNMTNALVVIAHIVMHPGDLYHMWYTTPSAGGGTRIPTRRPFWYIPEDEISGVRKTRPTKEEMS